MKGDYPRDLSTMGNVEAMAARADEAAFPRVESKESATWGGVADN